MKEKREIQVTTSTSNNDIYIEEKKKDYVEDEVLVMMYACGSNSHGQLGIINPNNTIQPQDLDKFLPIRAWNFIHDPQSQSQSHDGFLQVSSSLGGRHSLFLINDNNTDSPLIYSCGDSSQGQQLAIQPSSFSSSCVDKKISGFTSTQQHVDVSTTLEEIDFKGLISRVSNVHQDLKDKFVDSYRPVQVVASWETSFIVISSRQRQIIISRQTYTTKKKENNNNNQDFMTPQDYDNDDDYIISFGSNEFDLRGSQQPSHDLFNPNVVDIPKSKKYTETNTRRKIKLFSGCKHVIALALYYTTTTTTTTGEEEEKCVGIELFGWGAARHGQLGPVTNVTEEITEKSKGKLPRSIRPSLLDIDIPTPTPSSREEEIDVDDDDFLKIKIALGNQHSVIVCPSKIWCWGSNKNQQIPEELSSQIKPEEILEIKATWNGTYILTKATSSTTRKEGEEKKKKRLIGYGNNQYGQLGIQDESLRYYQRLLDPTFHGLIAGSEHVFILNGSTEVWGWGWNEHGNLGSTPLLSDPIPCPRPSPSPVVNTSNPNLYLSRPFDIVFQIPLNNTCRIHHVNAGCATSFIFTSSYSKN